MVNRFNRWLDHRARWKNWQKHSELQGREVDIILCQRTFLSAMRIQKRCLAIFGNTMKWTFNTCLRRSCAGLLVCRVKRRFDTGFAASDTQTGFSTDPMPEVPPRVDLVREISSAHSAHVYPGRISRFVVQHTEKHPGGPNAERSSLNQGTRSGAEPLTKRGDGGCHSAVVGHTKCSTETEVNDSG